MSDPIKDDELILFCESLMGWSPHVTAPNVLVEDDGKWVWPLANLNAAVRVAMESGYGWQIGECIAGTWRRDRWPALHSEPHTGTPESMARALITALYRASERQG